MLNVWNIHLHKSLSKTAPLPTCFFLKNPSPEGGPNSMDSVSPKSQICGVAVGGTGRTPRVTCGGFVNLPSHEGSMYIIYIIAYIYCIWYICTPSFNLIFLVSLSRSTDLPCDFGGFWGFQITENTSSLAT